MLVLTRKPAAGHQSVITIGPDVEVTVIEVKGSEVRLGIKAPKDVAVHRKEVYLSVQQENEAASHTGMPSAMSEALNQIRRKSKPR